MKTALVTGGAKRIGRAIALSLASAGADVAITYLNSAQDAEAALEEIRALGSRALAVQADLAHPEALISDDASPAQTLAAAA